MIDDGVCTDSMSPSKTLDPSRGRQDLEAIDDVSGSFPVAFRFQLGSRSILVSDTDS